MRWKGSRQGAGALILVTDLGHARSRGRKHPHPDLMFHCNHELLKSERATSQPLYGSEFVPGSNLSLKPGEWITARISFRIEVKNPKSEKLKVGRADLAMEWFQTGRTRVVKNCGVTFVYFPYDGPFESLNRRVVLECRSNIPSFRGGWSLSYLCCNLPLVLSCLFAPLQS